MIKYTKKIRTQRSLSSTSKSYKVNPQPMVDIYFEIKL